MAGAASAAALATGVFLGKSSQKKAESDEFTQHHKLYFDGDAAEAESDDADDMLSEDSEEAMKTGDYANNEGITVNPAGDGREQEDVVLDDGSKGGGKAIRISEEEAQEWLKNEIPLDDEDDDIDEENMAEGVDTDTAEKMVAEEMEKEIAEEEAKGKTGDKAVDFDAMEKELYGKEGRKKAMAKPMTEERWNEVREALQ